MSDIRVGSERCGGEICQTVEWGVRDVEGRCQTVEWRVRDVEGRYVRQWSGEWEMWRGDMSGSGVESGRCGGEICQTVEWGVGDVEGRYVRQ